MFPLTVCNFKLHVYMYINMGFGGDFNVISPEVSNLLKKMTMEEFDFHSTQWTHIIILL